MSVACCSCRTELGRHYFSGSQSQAVMTVSYAVAERINVRHMTIVFQKFVAIPAPKNSSSADHESSLHRNVVIVISMTILYATTKEIIQSSSSHSKSGSSLCFSNTSYPLWIATQCFCCKRSFVFLLMTTLNQKG